MTQVSDSHKQHDGKSRNIQGEEVDVISKELMLPDKETTLEALVGEDYDVFKYDWSLVSDTMYEEHKHVISMEGQNKRILKVTITQPGIYEFKVIATSSNGSKRIGFGKVYVFSRGKTIRTITHTNVCE